MEEYVICDICKHLQECKEKGLPCNITLKSDMTRQKALDTLYKCPRKDDKNDRKNI